MTTTELVHGSMLILHYDGIHTGIICRPDVTDQCWQQDVVWCQVLFTHLRTGIVSRAYHISKPCK